nr:molybdenum cofactor biosynthesis protein MoaE [uncultured Sphingomonas sp.]
MSAHVELATEPFDPAERLAAFIAALDDEGAIVSFTGRARGTGKDGQPLTALILETYRGVTLGSMEAIVADAHARFPITASLVVHRAGTILPGEAIVFVATASPHRRAAFEAADYLMDRLKAEAVFWKREEGPHGHCWIEPTDADRADTARWASTQD